MNAIDTNVLVYAIDFVEPAKQAKARALLRQLAKFSSQSVLLWQVAVEYLACLKRWQASKRITPADVEYQAQLVINLFPMAIPSRDVLLLALDLHSRHSLSHWDSMLLAACIVAGVDTLYSEDLTDGAIYDTVRVINPFV